jgi:hypothetical protein
MAHTLTSELSISIMSIDSVPSPSADDIVERTALLDVEQGVEYGSRTPLIGKGKSYQLSVFDIRMPMFTSLHRQKRSASADFDIFETCKVLHTISCMDPELQLIPVCCVLSFRIVHADAIPFQRFGGDVLAGLTVASMLIPQSVSYASTLAKLSPVTGLVCDFLPIHSATQYDP